MRWLWLLTPTASSADLDALVAAADAAFAGPMGCFAASGTAAWRHEARGWSDDGEVPIEVRFDHRVWRVDAFGHDEVRIAPMMLGTSTSSHLRYPEGRGRWFEWPAPVVALPVRSWGDVGTISVDELPDGGRTVVQAFSWDGYKRADGHRATELDAGLEPLTVALDVVDRRPGGCRIDSVGRVTLDERGLPVEEAWTFEGRCPLRRWTHTWVFSWGAWTTCERSGP